MATDDYAWPDSFIDWSRDITTEEVDLRTLGRLPELPVLVGPPHPELQAYCPVHFRSGAGKRL